MGLSHSEVFVMVPPSYYVLQVDQELFNPAKGSREKGEIKDMVPVVSTRASHSSCHTSSPATASASLTFIFSTSRGTHSYPRAARAITTNKLTTVGGLNTN